jgi:hypothetical protein
MGLVRGAFKLDGLQRFERVRNLLFEIPHSWSGTSELLDLRFDVLGVYLRGKGNGATRYPGEHVLGTVTDDNA